MYRKIVSFLTALAFTSASCTATLLTVSADDPPEPPSGVGTPPERPDGEAPPDAPGGAVPGSSAAPGSYDAVTTYSENIETMNESYDSTGTDENAVLVTGGRATLQNPIISRTSSDSTGGDSASFYGVGAALLATDGYALIYGGNVSTDAAGGAGLFAYGDGTVYAQNTTISTKQNTSGGIHAAGGGTVYAQNLNISTEGESSAAIRSDRGGGTMVVQGGTYSTSGTGSPAVYCTADIAVSSAQLNAGNSEAICIEGKNTLYLSDCNVSSVMPEDDRNDGLLWGVIVYQSMSGDSDVGNSEFYMEGGTLSCNGDVIYTTNTESHITLKGVHVNTSMRDAAILRATGNTNQRGWGSEGSNGADCTFTAIGQELRGDIVFDSISNLECYLTESSTLTGAVYDDESAAGAGGNGAANLYIDSTSVWIVDGNSECTNLYCAGAIRDEQGRTVAVLDASGNVLREGDSDYTVTCAAYSESVDLSGAAEAAEFSEFDMDDVLSGESDEEQTDRPTDAEETTDAAEETAVEESAETADVTQADPVDSAAQTDAAAENTAKSNSAIPIAIAAVVIGAVLVIGGYLIFRRKQK